MKNIKKWQPSRIISGRNEGEWAINKKVVAACSEFIVERQLPYYIRAIRENVHGKLLDCGCGQVPYYDIYKDLAEDIECVDWENSPHQIRYADKFADLNDKLPYNDASFNTVLLSDVLEHIYAPNVLISEISRILTKNGTLICFVPYTYWLHEDPHDYHRYTEYALRKLCEDAKLEITHFSAYGGGIDVVFDTILKLNSNRIKTVRVLTKIFTLITKTSAYKKSSVRGKKKMPLGYVFVASKST